VFEMGLPEKKAIGIAMLEEELLFGSGKHEEGVDNGEDEGEDNGECINSCSIGLPLLEAVFKSIRLSAESDRFSGLLKEGRQMILNFCRRVGVDGSMGSGSEGLLVVSERRGRD
jgi:hypothetical protein